MQNIMTREFTFCSRCGHICHVGGKDFMCTRCRVGPGGLFRPSRATKAEREELRLTMRWEEITSNCVRQFRQELSSLREGSI